MKPIGEGGMRIWAIRVCTLVLTTGTLLAQETDLELGQRFFLARCAVCHGPDGNSVQGVDLGRGKFRRVLSDDDIVQIIKIGIPNTAMPPIDIATRRARFIVAYLRSMASSQAMSGSGNTVRGKALFEGKGECLSCHRIKDKGSRVGPDLTDIGTMRRSLELERSLLEPNAEVLPENRFVRVVTGDGAAITGRLLNHDAFTVQLPHNYPNIKAFIWFNTNKERDWRIESSPAAQSAFAAAMQSPAYASNHYGNLNVSPVPVPEEAPLS